MSVPIQLALWLFPMKFYKDALNGHLTTSTNLLCLKKGEGKETEADCQLLLYFQKLSFC